jgi:hypothetical protein
MKENEVGCTCSLHKEKIDTLENWKKNKEIGNFGNLIVDGRWENTIDTDFI